MLSVIGAGSIDDLFVDVPAEARRPGRSPACRSTPAKWRWNATWRGSPPKA
jgi:glycine cleavage system pyridoxal-binding protein P